MKSARDEVEVNSNEMLFALDLMEPSPEVLFQYSKLMNNSYSIFALGSGLCQTLSINIFIMFLL
jgi:hypothetical protein